ncbi:MAG TPA: hypothetical protein VN259_01435 [Xanthomonadales bacterium]|nr:hypothetical protein [Xanthomonadales bacterium]
MLSVLAPLAWAQPAPSPDRLPPPVERVLNELSLDTAIREQVRQTLLRQREERQGADSDLRQRHRAELAALLTADQLVALDAARPPPGSRPPGPPPQRR